jgi:hypothetical protein
MTCLENEERDAFSGYGVDWDERVAVKMCEVGQELKTAAGSGGSRAPGGMDSTTREKKRQAAEDQVVARRTRFRIFGL